MIDLELVDCLNRDRIRHVARVALLANTRLREAVDVNLVKASGVARPVKDACLYARSATSNSRHEVDERSRVACAAVDHQR